MTYLEALSHRHHGRGGLCKSAAPNFHALHNEAIQEYLHRMNQYSVPHISEPMDKLRKLLGKKRVYFESPSDSLDNIEGFFELLNMTDAARLGYRPSAYKPSDESIRKFNKTYSYPLSPYEMQERRASDDRWFAKKDAVYDHIRRVQAQQAAESRASKPASDKPQQQEAASTETTEKAPEAAKPFNVRNYMGRAVGTTAGGAIGALAGNSLRNKILLGALGGGTGYLAGDYYDRGSNSLIGRGASKLVSLFKSNRDKLLENKLNK